jgi:hypothetical protein
MLYVAWKDPRVSVEHEIYWAESFWCGGQPVYAATEANLTFLWKWWHDILALPAAREVLDSRAAMPGLNEGQRKWVARERERISSLSPYEPEAAECIDALYAVVLKARPLFSGQFPADLSAGFRLYEPMNPPKLLPWEDTAPCPECGADWGAHAQDSVCPLAVLPRVKAAMSAPDPAAWVAASRLPDVVKREVMAEINYRS